MNNCLLFLCYCEILYFCVLLGYFFVFSRSDVSRSDVSRSDVSRSDVSRSDVSRSDVSRSDVSRSDVSTILMVHMFPF